MYLYMLYMYIYMYSYTVLMRKGNRTIKKVMYNVYTCTLIFASAMLVAYTEERNTRENK